MPRITPLKEMIVARRLIQADVAEEVKINEHRMSRIVNGRVKPTEYEKKNLAKFFGLAREEFPV